jgi:hypothetical protein
MLAQSCCCCRSKVGLEVHLISPSPQPSNHFVGPGKSHLPFFCGRSDESLVAWLLRARAYTSRSLCLIQLRRPERVSAPEGDSLPAESIVFRNAILGFCNRAPCPRSSPLFFDFILLDPFCRFSLVRLNMIPMISWGKIWLSKIFLSLSSKSCLPNPNPRPGRCPRLYHPPW